MNLPDPSFASADLIRELERRAPTDGAHPSGYPGLELLRSDRTTARAPFLYEPSICFVVQGRKDAHLGSTVFRYDPEQYLVLSMPMPLECEIIEADPTRPYLCLRLAVDPSRLSELLAELGDGGGPADGPSIDVSPTGPALGDALLRLLRSLEEPDAARVLAPQAEREVLFHVLRGEQGHILRSAVQREGSSARIARVLNHLKAHYADPVEVADLARLAAMSPSTFHHHFRALTEDSPLQYVKKIRLHHARRMMVHEGLGAGEASFRVGYSSPSQFSREFKRLFGATPVEEVERSR